MSEQGEKHTSRRKAGSLKKTAEDAKNPAYAGAGGGGEVKKKKKRKAGAPTEMSSKKPVGRFRQVVELDKNPHGDVHVGKDVARAAVRGCVWR